MRESGTPSTSSLFKPLQAEDILIAGETVKYDERRHWAILIEPFIETLAVLVVITIFAGNGASNSFGALLVLASIGYITFRLLRGGLRQAALYLAALYYFSGFLALYIVLGLIAAIVGFGFLAFNITTIALVVIILATLRFAYKAMIWLLFERLYITNRRVILAEGFLGSSISTMPLTRLTDLNYATTVPGELLGYASLRLETAGQDQALSWLQFLEKPAKFYATLIDLSTAAVGSVTEVDDDGGADGAAPDAGPAGGGGPASPGPTSPWFDDDEGTPAPAT